MPFAFQSLHTQTHQGLQASGLRLKKYLKEKIANNLLQISQSSLQERLKANKRQLIRQGFSEDLLEKKRK